MSRRWLSLAPIIQLLFVPLALAAAASCYTPSGNASTTLIPCNPGDPVSHCCSESDFCLSNGLCLNAGGNNGYSVQGCTDKNWGAPCDMRCAVSKVGM
ncbi:hypothetical protein CONLIGDRAFT_630271 [Coniochaeta ligniaria NRRL 30616]|uniref:Uncharacterized protein n=1 Tax=Coniochaeta ligniaria NRRL 30616 TaxID=1408157 RepID=A0A1J7IYM0_9PEZI|nr:hypothetical protein CONLIGDRAFT_630271 [Coniochaeta ligniaria NRRL 30616]